MRNKCSNISLIVVIAWMWVLMEVIMSRHPHLKPRSAQSHVVYSRAVNIQSLVRFKYSYGNVDVRDIPLRRSSKFIEIDGVGGSMVAMSLDESYLSATTTDIPLASKYGQVFLATLCGIPLYAKLKLMKKSSQPSAVSTNPLFYLPNKTNVSIEELVMIT